MVDFQQYMYEYLSNILMERGSDNIYKEVEKAHPGFNDRLSDFDTDLTYYKDSGDETVLVDLMREEFILSGMVEEARIEKMRLFWEEAGKKRREWMVEDQKERPKLAPFMKP